MSAVGSIRLGRGATPRGARLVVLAFLVGLLVLAPPAAASLRTGHHANKYPEPEYSSPTRPQLDRASLRFDDSTGSLSAAITLVDPLADPSKTSALRQTYATLDIGDQMRRVTCAGETSQWW